MPSRVPTITRCVCAAFIFTCFGLQAAEPRPNILFILIDDLGWADVGCNGSNFYETPNIDRLADEGMRFTDAYAASAICAPTRASILTGKYPSRMGITRASPQESLPSEDITSAEALKEGGYRTAHLGKWHLEAHNNKGPRSYPQDHGFELNVGGHSKGQPASYFYPYESDRQPMNNVPDLDDGKPGEYLTDRLTDEAIRFITAEDDRPFLMHLWYYTVHTPLGAKPEKIAKYEAKVKAEGIADLEERQPKEIGGGSHLKLQNNPTYAAMIESMDENVGRILGVLRDTGIEEETIVVFSSDNGGLSNGNVTSNLPLRGGKAWIYDGGIRVPLIIKWPGVTRAGSVSAEPVVSTDFYPTMLDMAGLKPRPKQHLDGLSLKSLLSGEAKTLKRDAIFFHLPVHHHINTMGPVGAVRARDFKLIQRFENMDSPLLFNLADDMGEKSDISDQNSEKARKLARLLANWRRSTGSTVPNEDELSAARRKIEATRKGKR